MGLCSVLTPQVQKHSTECAYLCVSDYTSGELFSLSLSSYQSKLTMTLKLPNTENWPAHIIAEAAYTDEELGEAITYLELVKSEEVFPDGNLLHSLGINVLQYNIEELLAVQNKLANAVLKRSSVKTKTIIQA